MANLAQIYDWFMTGKRPTQAQFRASWGSFWHKEETIPQSAISNLATVLAAKTEKDQFDAHKVAADAHADLFDAKADNTYVEELFSQLSVEYSGTTPSTIAIGGIPAGTNLSGRDLSSLFEEMLVVYQKPAFNGTPNVSSQSSTVEVGTTLNGSKTFTWSTTNNGNIKPNTIAVLDVTASSYLANLLANDGSELVNITTVQLNNNGATQQWKMEGINTIEETFQSSTRTVIANYIRYFGPTMLSVIDSAAVKALTSNAFQTSNANTFQLNTGASLSKFIVALPPSVAISSVVDIDALSADITSQYVLKGTVNVTDAGGTNRLYNIYEMNVGSAYAGNHRHEIRTV
jgi:hypothetical protein